MLHNGSASVFQTDGAGSIPVVRSRISVLKYAMMMY